MWDGFPFPFVLSSHLMPILRLEDEDMTRNLVSILFLAILCVFSASGAGALQAADSQRNFVVFCELLDNTNGLEDAVDYLIKDMVSPNDQLIIYSPVRLYSFSKTTLARPKSELIAVLREKLRTDISQASQNYKQVVRDLEAAATAIQTKVLDTDSSDESEDLRNLFMRYRSGMANLQQLRKVNEAVLRQIAELFRKQTGQNHIVMLLEREYRPIPGRDALNELHNVPVFAFQCNELFSSENMKSPMDTDALGEFFKQVPLTFHFLYITSKNTSVTGSKFESSGDLYAAFSKLAKTTGGVCDTMAEPAAGLKAVYTALKETK
jgi:hypothetical protein